MRPVSSIKERRVFEDPPIARFLFGDTRIAWLWLLVRLYVGYSWLDASLRKLADPAWMENGSALAGFWGRAVQVTNGRPVITFDWYRAFIQGMLDGGHYVWFAKLVAVGEFMVGVALIVGAFVGVAAVFGALMNWSFIMAGTASTNGVLLILAIALILAWKVAGALGLDRWLLPALGTPWAPGQVLRRESAGELGPALKPAPPA